MLSLVLLSLVVAIPIILWADRGWIWVFPLVFASSNTYFDLGFKLYTHEWALGLFVVGVSPHIVSMWQARKGEGFPSKSLLFLTLYLVFHLLVSLSLSYFDHLGGYGNILRRYSAALWAPTFAYFLARYDIRRYLLPALIALSAGFAIRVVLLLFTYFSPRTLIVPGVNLVFPVSVEGRADDLRQGSLGLGLMFLALAVSVRGRWMQILGWSGYALFLAGVLLGGGRASLGIYLTLPLVWLVLSRRFVAGLAIVGTIICGITVINVKPALLDGLDSRVQRTLSIVVLERGASQIHSELEGSNYYHAEMRRIAFERWLGSPLAALFGNRVRGFDQTYYNFVIDRMTPEQLLELGTETGIYEAGWLNVLAVTGGVGAILHLVTMYLLCRLPLRRIMYHGLGGKVGAISFLAVATTTTWLLFGWTTGGFPLTEILLGTLASIACRQELAALALLRRARESRMGAEPIFPVSGAASPNPLEARRPNLAGKVARKGPRIWQ